MQYAFFNVTKAFQVESKINKILTKILKEIGKIGKILESGKYALNSKS